jgi:hypothetical protein
LSCRASTRPLARPTGPPGGQWRAGAVIWQTTTRAAEGTSPPAAASCGTAAPMKACSFSSTRATSTLPIHTAAPATVKRQFTAACYLASKSALSGSHHQRATTRAGHSDQRTAFAPLLTWRNRCSAGQPRTLPPLRAASALVGSSAPIRLICVFLLAAGPDALVGGLPGGGTGAAGRASGVAWLPSDVVPEVGHSGCLDHVRLLKRAPSQRRAIEEPDAGLQERRPGGYPAHRAGWRPGTAGRCCRRRTRPRSFRPPRGEPVPGQLPGRRSRT